MPASRDSAARALTPPPLSSSLTHSIFLSLFIHSQVKDIHGKQRQARRSFTFADSCAAETGALLATDVAARGLDIPAVDWIVQFDPLDDASEYIHRVGRTARGAHGKGRALLFLMPQELEFLKNLRAGRVPLAEYAFPAAKVANV